MLYSCGNRLCLYEKYEYYCSPQCKPNKYHLLYNGWLKTTGLLQYKQIQRESLTNANIKNHVVHCYFLGYPIIIKYCEKNASIVPDHGAKFHTNGQLK